MYFIDVFYRSETLPANLIQVRTSFLACEQALKLN